MGIGSLGWSRFCLSEPPSTKEIRSHKFLSTVGPAGGSSAVVRTYMGLNNVISVSCLSSWGGGGKPSRLDAWWTDQSRFADRGSTVTEPSRAEPQGRGGSGCSLTRFILSCLPACHVCHCFRSAGRLHQPPQEYAGILTTTSNCGVLAHSTSEQRNGYGENLFACWGSASCYTAEFAMSLLCKFVTYFNGLFCLYCSERRRTNGILTFFFVPLARVRGVRGGPPPLSANLARGAHVVEDQEPGHSVVPFYLSLVGCCFNVNKVWGRRQQA